MLVDDHVLEAVAEQVHAAWAEEKLRQGFADHVFHVDVLDDALTATQCRLIVTGYEYCPIPRDQHHADMLPYSELAEHVKAYDRVTARAALAGIEAAGYRLVKEDER